MRSLRVCFLALLAASVAAPVHAQTTLEVGPLVGYYQPTGQFEMAPTYFVDLPARPQALRATVWGGELRVWFGSRFGLQVQGGVGSRRVSVALAVPVSSLPGGCCSVTRTRIVLVSALLLYNVLPTADRYRLWLGAGPGLIQHGGTTYQPYGSPVSSAGVLELGAGVPLFAHLHAMAGITTTLYDFHIMAPSGSGLPGIMQGGFQTDLLFHMGLAWTLRW